MFGDAEIAEYTSPILEGLIASSVDTQMLQSCGRGISFERCIVSFRLIRKRHFQVDTSGGTGHRCQINVAGNYRYLGMKGNWNWRV